MALVSTSWRTRVRRFITSLFALFLMLVGAGIVFAWRGMGHSAAGARLERMQKSPQWQNGAFENPQPLHNYLWPMIEGASHASPDVSPHEPVNTVTVDPEMFKTPPPTGLRVTWLGHSTTLIEIDGHRFLTDPLFSERISPVSFVGPLRWYPPLISLSDLPPIDAVLISHDHYDHLDEKTLTAMKAWKTTRFIVPLGVGAHLEYWGIDPASIVELDWWEETTFDSLKVTCTPARHASGRQVLDKDGTLWAGYAFTGPEHRVWYSGDTGLFPAMKDIGARLGPFDLALIEVGQYHRAWPDWHIGPEQAVKASQWVQAKVMLPIHWALLALAYHSWTEPIERASLEAKLLGVTLAMPRPGESFEPTALPAFSQWWPTLPFETAKQHPIVSSQVD